MKQTLLATALFLTAAALCAGDIEINGKFTDVKPGAKIPNGWIQNNAKSLLPLGKVELTAGSKADRKAVKIDNKDKETQIYSQKIIPAAFGKVVEIDADVKGTGKCMLGIYAYNAKNAYVWGSVKSVVVPSAVKSSNVKLKIVIPNRPANPIQGVRAVFGAAAKSAVTFEDVEIEVKNVK